MTSAEFMKAERVPGTCCASPVCDQWNCLGCEYLATCWRGCQKIDYCPRPRTCTSCGTDCTKCDVWQGPVFNRKLSNLNEGQALAGSKEFECSDCGGPVWLAPAGQEMHGRYPGVPILCVSCMMKRIENEKNPA